MKRDDRQQDKALEKLVASKLRGQLQTQAAGCPEAETLAAYVDGTLAAREHRQWEEHFAVCSRCQEQVATLARWSEEDAPLERQTVPTKKWALAPFRWAWAASVLLAVIVAGMWYTGEFRSRLRQTQEPPVATMSHAPSAATPAVEPVPSRPSTAADKGAIVEFQKAGTQSANAHLQSRPAAPANHVDALKDQVARRDLGLEGGSSQSQAKLIAPAPANIPEVANKTESAPAASGAQGGGPAPMAKPSDRARMAVGGLMGEHGAADELQTREATGGGRAGAASSRGRGAVARQETAQFGAVQPPAPGTAAVMKEKKVELGKQAATASLAQVSSSVSGAESWRVGPHGLIQKSDARGNWITVPSGVEADLFDISFPAPSAGWAVGHAGIVIRTVDAGKSWTRISTPTKEDVIKVSATTELAARIETRNHQFWETTDGGETWRGSGSD